MHNFHLFTSVYLWNHSIMFWRFQNCIACLVWCPECYRSVATFDEGFAEQLKTLVMQQHFSWLDSEKNAHKWYNGKISAKERCILISNWVGAAMRKLVYQSTSHSRGYSVSKRLVKLSRFQCFPLQLSGYGDLSPLSFVLRYQFWLGAHHCKIS